MQRALSAVGKRELSCPSVRRPPPTPSPRDISAMVRLSCGTRIRLLTSFITSPLLVNAPATRVMAARPAASGGQTVDIRSMQRRPPARGLVPAHRARCARQLRMQAGLGVHGLPGVGRATSLLAAWAQQASWAPAPPARRTQLLSHLVGQRQEGGLVHGQLAHRSSHVHNLLGQDLQERRAKAWGWAAPLQRPVPRLPSAASGGGSRVLSCEQQAKPKPRDANHLA